VPHSKEVAMRKRAFTKAVALASIVAILSLSAPGLFAKGLDKPFSHFKTFLKKPVVFLYSFLYFVPLYDIGKYIDPPSMDNSQVKRIKISGGLDIDRVSDGD
jgi:hypothetical protein